MAWRKPTASSRFRPRSSDEVAAELGRTLDVSKVPQQEKEEVLAAFAAHKGEVTEGFTAGAIANR